MAYKGLVRLILEYGSSVWDPQSESALQDDFEKVQNRAARPKEFMTTKVEVEEGAIKVCKSGKYYRCQFEDLELLPASCRGLKYLQTGELYFNIQVKRRGMDEDTGAKVYREKKFSSQNAVVDSIKLYQNKWFCSVCQQKLLKDTSFFSRVLPLPSENWSDFADMWFCHKHDENKSVSSHCDAQQNRKLLPKQRDCLVGDAYVLVCGSQVNSGAVRINKDGTICCNRCGHQIGATVGNKQENGHIVYKLNLYSLLVMDLQICNFKHIQDSNRSRSEKFFFMLLQEQSQMYTSFRFIIEATVPTVIDHSVTRSISYCLIWLMDPSVTVYTSRRNSAADEDSTDREHSETKLEKENVMKVLFRCHLSSAASQNRISDVTMKPVISLWKKDNTVYSISLPHPVFLEFIHQLISNTQVLPKSQRLMNGFVVSFLRQPDLVT